ncbi:hypothetical protein Hanom_Chr17g01590211 [Helianthus anomalus]
MRKSQHKVERVHSFVLKRFKIKLFDIRFKSCGENIIKSFFSIYHMKTVSLAHENLCALHEREWAEPKRVYVSRTNTSSYLYIS